MGSEWVLVVLLAVLAAFWFFALIDCIAARDLRLGTRVALAIGLILVAPAGLVAWGIVRAIHPMPSKPKAAVITSLVLATLVAGFFAVTLPQQLTITQVGPVSCSQPGSCSVPAGSIR